MVCEAIDTFNLNIPDAVLEDLQKRLANTRLPADLENDDWGYGVNTGYLRELITYWQDQYDWRSQEQAINAYPNFRTRIADVPIHFIHARGCGPAPLPIILSHGWPWTFWDYRHLIGPLTDPASYGGDPGDAFDVVLPSLPGFGFSTPVPRAGVGWIDAADFWFELMHKRLGYKRFVAAGADWGTAITSQLGHKFSSHVAGIHVCGGRSLDFWNVRRPWDLLGQIPLGDTAEEQERVLAWQRKFSSHVSAHVLGSQTIANAMHDSPAGMCSWILERRRSWSDCGGDVETVFSKDDLLTTMMIYWVTESFVNSVRYYRDAVLQPWQPSHTDTPQVGVPTAISVFRGDTVRDPNENYLRSIYNLKQLRIHDKGGHFAAAEQPQTIIRDLRDAFRPLRKSTG